MKNYVKILRLSLGSTGRLCCRRATTDINDFEGLAWYSPYRKKKAIQRLAGLHSSPTERCNIARSSMIGLGGVSIIDSLVIIIIIIIIFSSSLLFLFLFFIIIILFLSFFVLTLFVLAAGSGCRT
jgi:hypothetical protein